MKPPAITAWPPPRSSIRSGTSTSIAPNISEGTATKAVADQDRPGGDRRRDLGQRLPLGRRRLGHARRPATAKPAAITDDRAEDDLGPDFGGQRAERRADQGAGDRGPERGADHRAAALRRSGR